MNKLLRVFFLFFIGIFLLNIFSVNLVFAQEIHKSNAVTTKVGEPKGQKPGQSSGDDKGFVYYCQGNTSWQNSCSLGVAGCGPTSMAMAVSSLGVLMTPQEVDRVYTSQGYRSCGDSPSSQVAAIQSSWLKGLGLVAGENLVRGNTIDTGLAQKYLSEGYFIIASSRAFPCANCKSPGARIDHIFVVSRIDTAAGTVDIRDPNNCSYSDGNDENQNSRIKNIGDFPWLYAFPIGKG